MVRSEILYGGGGADILWIDRDYSINDISSWTFVLNILCISQPGAELHI